MADIKISPQLMAAIFQGYNALFQKQYGLEVSYWDVLSTVTTSSNLIELYGSLAENTGFREWIGERVIQGMETGDFAIKNRHYENTIGLDLDTIEDGRALNFGQTVVGALGADTKAHPDTLIWPLIQAGETTPSYDGSNFFATNHKIGKATYSNLIVPGSGAGAPWYLANLAGALKPVIFQKRKDYQFRRIDAATDSIVFLKNKALYGVDARIGVGLGLWQYMLKSTAALDAAGFVAARTKLQQVKTAGSAQQAGRPYTARPTHLFVPSSLQADAENLINTPTLANGAGNVLYKAVEVVVVPYLD